MCHTFIRRLLVKKLTVDADLQCKFIQTFWKKTCYISYKVHTKVIRFHNRFYWNSENCLLPTSWRFFLASSSLRQWKMRCACFGNGSCVSFQLILSIVDARKCNENITFIILVQENTLSNRGLKDGIFFWKNNKVRIKE